MSSIGPRDLLFFYQCKKEHEYLMDRITAQDTHIHEEVNELKSQLAAAKREQEASNRAMQDFADKNAKTEVERRKDFNREKDLLKRVCSLEASADSLKRQLAALEDRGAMPLTQSAAVDTQLVSQEMVPAIHEVTLTSPTASQHLTCRQSHKAHKSLSVSETRQTTAREKNAPAAMQEPISEEEYFSCEERAALSYRRRAARKAREAKARAMMAPG